jgi:hypothetical protein
VAVVLHHGYTRDDPSTMTVLARPGKAGARNARTI